MIENEVEENVCSTIIKQLEQNKLSHAYLIEADHYSNIEILMQKISKIILCKQHGDHSLDESCNICHLIDTKQCIDLKMLYPKGNVIKKEQLLEVKEQFKTTSSNQYRIYIIYEADRLNSSSANTILKFLEEPEEGIIAFLIAQNRYHVLETLVSRCQILSLHKTTFTEVQSDTLEFIKKVTKNSDFYMDFKEIIADYMPDKEKARSLLDQMEYFFHQLLLFKITSNSLVEGIENFENISKDSIIKYISVLEEEKQKLNFNVNYRLWVDHLFIRLLEVLAC